MAVPAEEGTIKTRVLQILRANGGWMNARRVLHLHNKGLHCWQRYTAPSFYLRMAMLADQGLIEQRHYLENVGGKSFKQIQYRAVQ